MLGAQPLLPVGAVIYIEAERQRRVQEPLELFPPLRVAIAVVGAGEADRLLSVAGDANRIVYERLGGEGKRVNSIVPELFAVFWNAVRVGCEDVVEELGGFDEALEVNRVFLVPEDGGEAALTAPEHEALQLLSAGVVVLSNPVFPGAAIALPGRFDENEVGSLPLQDGTPVVGAEGDDSAFGLKAGQ